MLVDITQPPKPALYETSHIWYHLQPHEGNMKSFLRIIFFPTTFFFLFASVHTTIVSVQNSCGFSIWAAASPSGGKLLESGQTWTLNIPPGTSSGRIWGRTGCSFNSSGLGKCQTGDCGGVLECKTSGRAPNTLAEFAFNQAGGLDFFDVSLVNGFNLPMEFSPVFGCSSLSTCSFNITGVCPYELLVPGGCNNPCTIPELSSLCCSSGPEKCKPTLYSRFFKERCPDAYSYPYDDNTSTFTCPGGTNYRVVFCPDERSYRGPSYSLVCGS